MKPKDGVIVEDITYFDEEVNLLIIFNYLYQEGEENQYKKNYTYAEIKEKLATTDNA